MKREAKTDTKLNQLEQIELSATSLRTRPISAQSWSLSRGTTNPSLIYTAPQKKQHVHLVDEIMVDRKQSGLTGKAQIEDIIDHLLVKVWMRIFEDH